MIENSTVRLVVIGLLVLLALPLLVMLRMMAVGAFHGSGMMSQMAGMMSGGATLGMMSSGATMVLCAAWLTLIAATLIFLIVLLVRSPKPPITRDKAA